MSTTAARDLQIHLDMLGIESILNDGGATLTIVDPAAMLAHLTDEAFIARQPATPSAEAILVPVPTHRTDNPVGALLEWATKRKVTAIFAQSENIGTATSPRFGCEAICEHLTIRREAASKSQAKRDAALAMLEWLATKHGKERP